MKEKWIDRLYVPATFVLSVLFGMILQKLMQPKDVYRYALFLLFLAFGILILIWKFRDAVDDRKVILLLFLLAFAARLVYVLDISIVTNQHDTRNFSVLENNYGHTGYIRYLMENWSLPDFDVRGKSQFYHPPLHHLICAVWLKLQTAVGVSFDDATENLQILTLFYSMVSLYAVKKILDLFRVKGIAYYVSFSLVAFHPTFFLLAGSINNDGLSVMFIFLAVYAGLAWYRNPSWYRILAVAVCIGLSMMSKLATGVIAPAMAMLFLIRFIKQKGFRAKGKMVGQFAAFGAVCIPLGIGWQVRNFLKFGVPLTYVPRLSDQADQYLGGYSVAERFFEFRSLSDFGVFPARAGTQGAEYFEHNIPLAALKSSLFGEYSVWKNKWMLNGLATVLFWITVALTLLAVVAAICLIVRFLRKKAKFVSDGCQIRPAELAFFAAYAATILISYAVFCFSYPHFCSMDFRYIVPLLLIGSVLLGVFLNSAQHDAEEGGGKKAGFMRILSKAALAAVIAFSALSLILYPFYF
ncbi:MAG: glycosyltransferase family 39 protein [Clostridia bacterium]|nr:glycosyltransferase family 39 protein [Clostridia bacterium]